MPFSEIFKIDEIIGHELSSIEAVIRDKLNLNIIPVVIRLTLIDEAGIEVAFYAAGENADIVTKECINKPYRYFDKITRLAMQEYTVIVEQQIYEEVKRVKKIKKVKPIKKVKRIKKPKPVKRVKKVKRIKKLKPVKRVKQFNPRLQRYQDKKGKMVAAPKRVKINRAGRPYDRKTGKFIKYK